MVRRASPEDSPIAPPEFSGSVHDGPGVYGGHVPGLDHAPAFRLLTVRPSSIPVLIAVPHAGRRYPAELLARMRAPDLAVLRLEDRLVDQLGIAIARETGAALLLAEAPRAMIDLNRATDDVDWSMFVQTEAVRAQRQQGGALVAASPSQRARGGLGLIPRRLPGLGEIWARPHHAEEMATRIAAVHEPYHDTLAVTLEALQRRWGAALLVDLHSMPSLEPRGGMPAPEFVVGDRFGASCAGALVAQLFHGFSRARRIAAHNRPYAGGYVLERHAAPQRNIHALQLEIDRASYLDARHAELGAGFAATVALLVSLIRDLAADVADLGRSSVAAPRRDDGWREAAE